MKKNLHHAYGIIRNDSTVPSLIGFFTRELGVTASGSNPDFFHERFETLAIDDSRRIKDIALARKFSPDNPRIFLIELYGATREAQNALLKLFEEPEEGNHFFLILPSLDILLPTLRSRLSIGSPVADIAAALSALAPSTPSAATSPAIDIEKFFKSPLKDKIALVDGLAADISDEKAAKHTALDFLNALETYIYIYMYKQGGGKSPAAAAAAAFEAIAMARTYLNDRAPSVKMLLEYVALCLQMSSNVVPL